MCDLYRNNYNTLEWLRLNNIYYDTICFTKDKGIISGDIVVDDYVGNLIKCNESEKILIDAPYNRDENRFKKFSSLFEYADSLNVISNGFKNGDVVYAKTSCDWKKIYKLPLRYDDVGYVWANNDMMAISFSENYDTKQHEVEMIVNRLNGDTSITFDKKFTIQDNIDFYCGNEYAFCIRGWGSLTSAGGYNLTNEQAINIQDSFAEWILETLNN